MDGARRSATPPARTGWSARMLRYLERAGLVVPDADAQRLPALRPARAEPAPLARRAARAASASRSPTSPSPRGCAASPSSARPSTAGSPASTTLGWVEWEQRKHERLLRRRVDTRKDPMAATTALRREGPRPRGRGQAADRVGRPADAGARGDPGAVRARAAARRLPRLRLPARHDRDREPDADAEGGRRGRRAVRLEPALDAGRRRRGARRRVRHLRASRSRARTTTRTTPTSRRPSTTSRTSRWTTAPT